MKPYQVIGPCIEWNRSRTAAGYGNVWRDGRVRYVHRLEWEKHNGPIPPGLCVLHKCDNRSCYNIDHLFLGTKADNMADKTMKGRGKNPNQRLTRGQVDEIRQDAAQGAQGRKLAEKFGVTPSNISHIVRNKSWR